MGNRIKVFVFFFFGFALGCASSDLGDETSVEIDPSATISETASATNESADVDTDLDNYSILFERSDLVVEVNDMNDTGRSTDEVISPREAQEIVFSAYPDYNFGEDIMSGPEEVGEVWIDGYMMSATVDNDVIEVIVDAHSSQIVKVVSLDGFAVAHASACTVSGIASGTIYSQLDINWAATKLGNSSTWTIYDSGCYITALAMAYNDLWGVSTTPKTLNTSAIAAGCFAAGSAYLTLPCTINSRGGPHYYTYVSTSAVATSICSGRSVVAFVTWGSGHKMLTYYYSGGSTSSMGSYKAADPYYGDLRSLSGYTATSWVSVY